MSRIADRRARHAEPLAEQQRISKRPLLAWAQSLQASLDAPDPDLPGLQNNLALLSLYAIGPEAAAHNCRVQIDWAIRTNNPDLAMQPIVNLARLDRFAGRRDDALATLDIVHCVAMNGVLALGTRTFVVDDGDLRAVAAVIWRNERFQLDLTLGECAVRALFADRAFGTGTDAGASLRAEQFLQAGVIFDADDLFDEGARMIATHDNPYNRLLLDFYRAWSALDRGDVAPADALVAGLAKLGRSIAAMGGTVDHRFLRLTHAAALLARAIGAASTSPLFEQALALARRLDDVHLALLCRQALGHNGDNIARETAASGYRALRGVDCPPPDATMLQAVHAALADVQDRVGVLVGSSRERIAAAA